MSDAIPITKNVLHETETPIRERLARRFCERRLPAMNLTNEARERLIQQGMYQAQADVDAILAELAEPSEGMERAAERATTGTLDRQLRPLCISHWRAMIQHIRDGGS